VASSGWTALYVAALNGHELIVEALLAEGASTEAAFRVGDKRTNINLSRMIESSGRRVTPLPVEPPELPEVAAGRTGILGAASRAEPMSNDWKAAAQQQATASSGVEAPLSGMSELEAMRLRQEWRAPPTFDEQRAADNARQTVFKYRHDRILELQATSAPLTATPVSITAPPTPPSASARAVPSVPSEPERTILSQLEAVETSTLLSRLEAVEATLASLRSAKGIDPNGYADGYGDGYAAGFAAGRKAE